MRYFARVDESSTVTEVITAKSLDWCLENLGGTWLETWVGGGTRKNFAAIGSPYREDLDAFVPFTENDGWILNEETAQWEPPTPMPEAPEGDMYFWCNECLDWKLESEIDLEQS